MKLGTLKGAIERFELELEVTDETEVVLDTEEGVYGISSVTMQDDRLIVSAGDLEDGD